MTTAASLLTPAELEPFLAGQLGASIVGLELVKGGYSREMWSFVTLLPGGVRRALILCADSASSVVGSGEQALSRQQEAGLLHVLHAQGLPVPDAVASGGSEGPLGRDFLVMERKGGTAVVGPLRRDPWYPERRHELGAQLAGILAGLHGAAVPDAVLGAPPPAAAVAQRALAQWTAELAATPSAQTPTLERAVAWMRRNPPPAPERVTLVHGDFRTGNILHGHDDGQAPDGFRTVLDWEMAHWGDPLEDLAWAQLACWRVGTGRVGGLVDLAEWAQLYAEAADRTVDASALRWWEVLGSVKMSCLMKRAAAKTTADERGLLDRLFDDLGSELEDRLLPPEGGTSS